MVRADGRVYWDYRVCAWVDARPDRAASAPSAAKGEDDERDDLSDVLPRQPAPREAASLPPARRA